MLNRLRSLFTPRPTPSAPPQTAAAAAASTPTPTPAPARNADPVLAYIENDNTISLGATTWNSYFRDRINWDRETVLTEVITAWRSNPIAKRIVEITTEFVVGDGFGFTVEKAETQKLKKFLTEFWKGELNDLDTQIPEFCDEVWRSGDLLILCTVDEAGMTYVRALPAELIKEIETAENDYRQELRYKRTSLDDDPYLSYSEWKKATDDEKKKGFILHFALNRAVGSAFGESDLASVLYWIKLYRQFLEDRARLNFFRQLFTFIVQKAFSSWKDKMDFIADFVKMLPRKAGGVLAVDKGETVGTLNPNLASFEAGEDGLAIKRMIAVGVQMPMHYLAEPESSTSTTADSSGTPTFRRFKSRQKFMVRVISRICAVAIEIRRGYDDKLPNGQVTITAPDITERDNANLSLAVLRITQAFAPLYNAKKISAEELIRLVYRFLAETPPETIPDTTTPVNMGGGAPTNVTDPNRSQEADNAR